MMLEFLQHLLSFDLPWLISLIMDNLMMVFAVLALAFFFDDKKTLKSWLLLFFITVFATYAISDFTKAIGFAFLGASFLLADTISRVAVTVIAEATPSLKDKLIIVYTARFFAVLILFKILMYF